MTTNLTAYFDEKYDEGTLPLTEEKKASVIHLPGTGNGTPKKRLRGDRNQCPSCHEYFNSTKAFDQHRTGQFNGSRRCLTVPEMKSRNFGRTEDGFWLCPISEADRQRLDRFRGKNKGKDHV